MAPASPGGAGPARRRRRDRLVVGDPRRGPRPGAKGGSLTGPNPVDRGQNGATRPVLSHANGLPLPVGVSAAHTHDSQALQPLVAGLPALRSRRGPRRCPAQRRAGTGYDCDSHRRWRRDRGIVARLARRSVDSSERLGRYRWKIECTLAWLTGYRRLTIRYEHPALLLAAFRCLTAALTS